MMYAEDKMIEKIDGLNFPEDVKRKMRESVVDGLIRKANANQLVTVSQNMFGEVVSRRLTGVVVDLSMFVVT